MGRGRRVILHDRIKVSRENIGIIMGLRKKGGIMIKRAHKSTNYPNGNAIGLT